MVPNISNNSLEGKLNEFIGKSVTITQDGFLKNKYSIHKLKYFIEYEILNITDEESQNYLKIDLNQIHKNSSLSFSSKLFRLNSNKGITTLLKDKFLRLARFCISFIIFSGSLRVLLTPL